MFFIGPPFGNYVDLKNIVAIKGSFTLEPRTGLLRQILKTLRYNFTYRDWVNKIGLRNKGIDYAIENYKKGTIVSIAVLNENEIPKLVEKVPKNMDIELNVSCPNAEKNMVSTGLSAFLNDERQWCIIKLSPMCSHSLIDEYYTQGFRQFHCSNTIPVPEGGLSGSAIIPFNEKNIRYIKSKYTDVQVIGGGGIKTWDNVEQYQKMGADHFAFSSVTFCPYLFGKLYWNIINN